MIEYVTPTWKVKDIYAILPDHLHQLKKKALLLDLDNTLIAWNQTHDPQKLKDWIAHHQQEGIDLMIVSNNSKSRVKVVADDLGLGYISRACKPLTKGMKEALGQIGRSKEEALMVGDQMMTDILGANLCGIDSILVQPVVASDQWNTRINRMIESVFKRQMLAQVNREWGKFTDDEV